MLASLLRENPSTSLMLESFRGMKGGDSNSNWNEALL